MINLAFYYGGGSISWTEYLIIKKKNTHTNFFTTPNQFFCGNGVWDCFEAVLCLNDLVCTPSRCSSKQKQVLVFGLHKDPIFQISNLMMVRKIS